MAARRPIASGVKRKREPEPRPDQAAAPIQACRLARFSKRRASPARGSDRIASSASSVVAGPPTTPSPQASQRRTGGPSAPGALTQPNSGSPQAGQGGLSGPTPASSGTCGSPLPSTGGSVRIVQLDEIMTASVVTAPPQASTVEVARLMRDHGVGSVVIVDPEGSPVAMVTDRDLAVRVMAGEAGAEGSIGDHASRPLVTGEPGMDLDEAAALMVTHRVRRLPVVEDDRLAGIVTLDDIAVRTGNLEVAQRMTQEVIEGALPQFYFHERG